MTNSARCPKCGRPEAATLADVTLRIMLYGVLPAAILYFFLAGCGIAMTSWGPGVAPSPSLWPREHMAAVAVSIAAGLAGFGLWFLTWLAGEG